MTNDTNSSHKPEPEKLGDWQLKTVYEDLKTLTHFYRQDPELYTHAFNLMHTHTHEADREKHLQLLVTAAIDRLATYQELTNTTETQIQALLGTPETPKTHQPRRARQLTPEIDLYDETAQNIKARAADRDDTTALITAALEIKTAPELYDKALNLILENEKDPHEKTRHLLQFAHEALIATLKLHGYTTETIRQTLKTKTLNERKNNDH